MSALPKVQQNTRTKYGLQSDEQNLSLSRHSTRNRPLESAGNAGRRLERFAAHRAAWEAELEGMGRVHEYAAEAEAGRMVPRQVRKATFKSAQTAQIIRLC